MAPPTVRVPFKDVLPDTDRLPDAVRAPLLVTVELEVPRLTFPELSIDSAVIVPLAYVNFVGK